MTTVALSEWPRISTTSVPPSTETFRPKNWSSSTIAYLDYYACDGLAGTKTKLWPGINIGIPTTADHSKFNPDSTKEAVLAAFRSGSDGVTLYRKYSEMKLANLKRRRRRVARAWLCLDKTGITGDSK